MKCENCENDAKNENKYCSLKCRNIYVNKYLRDYSKNSEGLKKKGLIKKEKYEKDPKFCKECNNMIPYEKKYNNFCNKSCSASFTNKNRNNRNRNFSEDGLRKMMENLKKGCYSNKRFKKVKKEYYSDIKRCKYCNKMLIFKKRKNIFCNITCKNDYHTSMRTKVKNYKKECKFKFKIIDFPNEFNLQLIEKYGWYSPSNGRNNLNGVSRDHMISVMEGFNNNIDPKILSHPANCQLMRHNDNISKNNKSSISVEELKKE